ncbi:hypothetical protein [Stenotrophomonas acidaminiphila]|uniref:hypothetical protein n=1 Tax=Stenotrophomonas acidaminiphila TaxID=128780 RepID=UPI0028AE7EB8|nr:hypothetical protein [Stenotrophomonas acidaminiphila]
MAVVGQVLRGTANAGNRNPANTTGMISERDPSRMPNPAIVKGRHEYEPPAARSK